MLESQTKGHNDEHCIEHCPLGKNYPCNPFPPNIHLGNGLFLSPRGGYPEKCDHPQAQEYRESLNSAIEHVVAFSELHIKLLNAKNKAPIIFEDLDISAEKKAALLKIVWSVIDMAGVVEPSKDENSEDSL